jgi:hypothetical protein
LSKRIVALAAVIPLAVAVAACSSAATPKPKPEAVATVTTSAQTTPSPAAAAPTVSSGCAYLQSWYNTNWGTWQAISSDIGNLGKDVSNFDTAAAASDGQQLSDDVGKLTSIDNAQIPHGKNAASVVGLDFAKAQLGLAVTAQFAEAGNLTTTAKDIGQVANILKQADTDMGKCSQVS